MKNHNFWRFRLVVAVRVCCVAMVGCYGLCASCASKWDILMCVVLATVLASVAWRHTFWNLNKSRGLIHGVLTVWECLRDVEHGQQLGWEARTMREIQNVFVISLSEVFFFFFSILTLVPEVAKSSAQTGSFGYDTYVRDAQEHVSGMWPERGGGGERERERERGGGGGREHVDVWCVAPYLRERSLCVDPKFRCRSYRKTHTTDTSRGDVSDCHYGHLSGGGGGGAYLTGLRCLIPCGYFFGFVSCAGFRVFCGMSEVAGISADRCSSAR